MLLEYPAKTGLVFPCYYIGYCRSLQDIAKMWNIMQKWDSLFHVIGVHILQIRNLFLYIIADYLTMYDFDHFGLTSKLSMFFVAFLISVKLPYKWTFLPKMDMSISILAFFYFLAIFRTQKDQKSKAKSIFKVLV